MLDTGDRDIPLKGLPAQTKYQRYHLDPTRHMHRTESSIVRCLPYDKYSTPLDFPLIHPRHQMHVVVSFWPTFAFSVLYLISLFCHD